MNCINENWFQIFSLFLANAALIIWFRSEARNDWRHMDAKIDATHAKIDANQKQTLALIEAIQKEITDFHGRLCAIEERNRK